MSNGATDERKLEPQLGYKVYVLDPIFLFPQFILTHHILIHPHTHTLACHATSITSLLDDLAPYFSQRQ
jgi:hypothetical protein